MTKKNIPMIDPRNWIEDKNARAISYFLTERKMPMAINRALVDELRRLSEQRGRQNARLCLHASPEATLQDMLIVEYQDKTCRRPHKHPTKKETMHIIEGQMMSFVFDDCGKLVEKTILSPENFIYIMPMKVNHLYIAVTPVVVYREVKLGPFNRETDNIYWDEGYIEALKGHVDFMKDIRCGNPRCSNRCPLGRKEKA